MEFQTLDQIVAQVKQLGLLRNVAVAGAADLHVVQAAAHGKREGMANPILVGEPEKVAELLRSIDENPADFDIEPALSGMNEAETAVEIIKAGKADFLMKGMMETKDVLRPIVKKENGLHTGRAMSVVAIDELPSACYHKLLCSTDGGMLTYPTLEQKRDVIINAVEAFRGLGYELPKVAVLAAVEKVNPKMPETVDAAELERMNRDGEITGCYVKGPVSYDCAMDKEVAEHKGFDCPHCGDFDILIVPNIHAGNILGKCLITTCKGRMAGVVMGCRVPVVFNSRGASAEEKFYSLAAASLIAANLSK